MNRPIILSRCSDRYFIDSDYYNKFEFTDKLLVVIGKIIKTYLQTSAQKSTQIEPTLITLYQQGYHS